MKYFILCFTCQIGLVFFILVLFISPLLLAYSEFNTVHGCYSKVIAR